MFNNNDKPYQYIIAKITNHKIIIVVFFKSNELNKYISNQSRHQAGNKFRENFWKPNNGANNHNIVTDITHIKTKYSHNSINIRKNSLNEDCLNVKIKSRFNNFK